MSVHDLNSKLIHHTYPVYNLNFLNLQDEITTVILPDVSIEIVTKFLKLVYTGSTGVSNNDEMNEINHFGAKILVSFYKHLNNNLRAI